MHIITPSENKDTGAYSVINEMGEKVVFFFIEKDDAERYAIMLEDQGEEPMHVIHVADRVAIAACEKTGTRYTVIGKDDFVIPVETK
jgi:hypothetical protein|tara:strand:+ start:405 stop:665 length:261 start_codon:yes stop_codon:yes gene_type:complete